MLPTHIHHPSCMVHRMLVHSFTYKLIDSNCLIVNAISISQYSMFVNDFWSWNECTIVGSYPLLFRSPYTYIVKRDGPLRIFSEGRTFPFQTIIRMRQPEGQGLKIKGGPEEQVRPHHKVQKAILLQWQKVCM